MNFDHNKNFGLYKFQSSYRKLYLNNPKGYSKKIINAQTVYYLYTIFVTEHIFKHSIIIQLWFNVHSIIPLMYILVT